MSKRHGSRAAPGAAPGPARAPQPDLSNERFGFTVFMSLCAHAVLILGVGFGVQEHLRNQPSLEITLAQYRSEQAPEEADFLAQENQSGSGTLEEKAAPSTPVQAPFQAQDISEAGAPRQTPASPPSASARAQLSSSRAGEQALPRDTAEETAPEPAERADSTEREVESLDDSIASLQAQLDLQRQAYAKRPRKYTLSSASTRKARDALYLDAWRKQIEAVGNLNYPEEASRQQLYGTLRLMVALQPDGRVSEVRVLRSSGHRLLDQAAVRIVHLAAPFEPFPPDMRAEVDILEIIRTWQFHPGDSLSSY